MGRVGLGVAAGCAAATCAIAAALVARRASARARWRRAVALLREFEEGCATPTPRLRQVVDAMVVEMHAGLASDGGSKLKMLLTFVDALPAGNEQGTYYSIDLGGTNFRVLRVEVGAVSVVTSREVKLPIPEELTKGTIEELFNFVAMTLKEFVETEDVKDEQRALGFTFSFPVRQTSVSSGSLIRWTKGFLIEDAVGKDVAQCLNEALARSGLNVRVTALVNDTVGTLALGHYYDEDTVAAVIIGAGTNACYIERTDAIIKCQGLLTNSGGMVVNMEWGNFWSSHLPRTPYDISLDDETQNRNDQGFEKMISGIYLGEIARLVLHRMALESDVFGDAADHLSTPFTLSTPLLAAIRKDDSPDLSEVRRILQEHLKIMDTPLKTRRLVVKVCDIVTRRAARLAAAGIVGILKKLGRDGSGVASSGRTRGQLRRTVVAIEGGLYEGYPVFREYLDEALVEILGEEVAQTVALRVTEDGSGAGAALLAAVHSSNRQQGSI
ncbi:hexokinase-3 [Sorghum bicolor]|uniref:hexokinase-3 n=1 Tax=Sorghum bicolor TaxID=4558 RepID=UPI0001A856B7|nr:hexokinase-3 [Sorghum bicolor]|eukprot:XP_002459072.1 hexokinase-3 [Sorghum bicolor]